MRTNYLKPNEALSELFAGLIVTQSFTLATSVMSGGIDAKNILISVIGANTAWGLIDAILYIMNSVFDRNRSLRFARVIAIDPDKRAGLEKISAELDPILVPVTDEQVGHCPKPAAVAALFKQEAKPFQRRQSHSR